MHARFTKWESGKFGASPQADFFLCLIYIYIYIHIHTYIHIYYIQSLSLSNICFSSYHLFRLLLFVKQINEHMLSLLVCFYVFFAPGQLLRPVRLLRVWISEGLTQADS